MYTRRSSADFALATASDTAECSQQILGAVARALGDRRRHAPQRSPPPQETSDCSAKRAMQQFSPEAAEMCGGEWHARLRTGVHAGTMHDACRGAGSNLDGCRSNCAFDLGLPTAIAEASGASLYPIGFASQSLCCTFIWLFVRALSLGYCGMVPRIVSSHIQVSPSFPGLRHAPFLLYIMICVRRLGMGVCAGARGQTRQSPLALVAFLAQLVQFGPGLRLCGLGRLAIPPQCRSVAGAGEERRCAGGHPQGRHAIGKFSHETRLAKAPSAGVSCETRCKLGAGNFRMTGLG